MRRRAGFTLLEVTIAIAVAGIAITVAVALVSVTSGQVAIVSDHARAVDMARNGERLLRRLVGQMDMPARTDPPSVGTGELLRFATWCEVPSGWQERCTAELSLSASHDPAQGLLVRLSTGERFLLLPGHDVERILLLGRIARGPIWVEDWNGSGSLPEAIGIASEGDTLILRRGDRP